MKVSAAEVARSLDISVQAFHAWPDKPKPEVVPPRKYMYEIDKLIEYAEHRSVTVFNKAEVWGKRTRQLRALKKELVCDSSPD